MIVSLVKPQWRKLTTCTGTNRKENQRVSAMFLKSCVLGVSDESVKVFVSLREKNKAQNHIVLHYEWMFMSNRMKQVKECGVWEFE